MFDAKEKTEGVQVIVNGLETRINDICILIEKFDIQGISDKLHTAFEKIEKTNSRLDENIARMMKERNVNKESSHVNDVQNKEEELTEIKSLKEELFSYKNSYELMVNAVNEKDKIIKIAMEEKEKYMNKLQEKDRYIHQIRADAANEKSELERNFEKVTEKYKEVVS